VSKASRKIKRVAGGLILGISGILLFSSCSVITQFIPPSDEVRYKYVNQIKSDLDYSSAGEVVEESYDNGGGVVAPSVFHSTIKGSKAFDTLSSRVQALPYADCAVSTFQAKCKIKHVNIDITKADNAEDLVELRISDRSNGRGITDDK
jgi:hypothetical protein